MYNIIIGGIYLQEVSNIYRCLFGLQVSDDRDHRPHYHYDYQNHYRADQLFLEKKRRLVRFIQQGGFLKLSSYGLNSKLILQFCF